MAELNLFKKLPSFVVPLRFPLPHDVLSGNASLTRPLHSGCFRLGILINMMRPYAFRIRTSTEKLYIVDGTISTYGSRAKKRWHEILWPTSTLERKVQAL